MARVETMQVWEELRGLMRKGHDKEAISLLEERLPHCDDPDELGEVAQRLATLYRASLDENNRKKAVQYAALAGQVYIRMGKMAQAVALIAWLKKDAVAKRLMEELKQSVSQAFSYKPPEYKAPDDDIPLPTPFQILDGFVPFEEPELPEMKHQFEGAITNVEKPLKLFSELNAPAIGRLIDVANLKELKGGETLFSEGDTADAFYIVVKGTLNLSSSVGFQKVFREGDFFGELAVLGDLKRTATMKTKLGAQVLEFSKKGIEKAMAGSEELHIQIMSFYESRLFLNVAARTPFFKGLSEDELKQIYDFFSSRTTDPNAVLFKQGDESDNLIFIVRGMVDIFRDGAKIARLGPGQFLGEMGFIQNSSRTATVKADGKVELLQCHKLVFDELCEKFPKIKVVLKEIASVRQGNVPLADVPVID